MQLEFEVLGARQIKDAGTIYAGQILLREPARATNSASAAANGPGLWMLGASWAYNTTIHPLDCH